MILKVIPHAFTVCQVEDYSLVRTDSPYCFIGKTEEENSLVCRTCEVPANVLCREDGWRAFCVSGPLDFSLVGILSGIASVLAQGGISIFAVSTYNTDYLLLKEESLRPALSLLQSAGYSVEE